jgi:hypothetical protein
MTKRRKQRPISRGSKIIEKAMNARMEIDEARKAQGLVGSLPFNVGDIIDVQDCGRMYCDCCGKGSVRFLLRKDEKTTECYEVATENIIDGKEGYYFSGNASITSQRKGDTKTGRNYIIYDKKLKSAKI